MSKIKVMILKSGLDSKFEVVELESSNVGLEFMQEKVGGHIEIPYLSRELDERGIDMVINEEGKLIGLEPTIAVISKDKIVDVVVGTVIFCGHDDEGDSVGLNDLQMKFIENTFKNEVAIQNKKGGFVVKALNI